MRISVIQMSPSHDKAANLRQAGALIEAAVASDRPDVISLPEMWTCLGGDREAKFKAAETLPAEGANEPGGEAYEFLRDIARAQGIHVHGGSIGERHGERLFNTTVVFGPDGGERGRYRKIHLFDIVTPGGTGYRESATFDGGEAIVTAPLGATKAGLAICYDLRFPELFLKLRRAGASLIFLPAAFTVETGRDHWETLLRARAIETQCWIAAAATYGRHEDASGNPRFTYGHSLICDPWGGVVARVSDGTGWASARMDAALTEQVRRNMPVLDHRRLA